MQRRDFIQRLAGATFIAAAPLCYTTAYAQAAKPAAPAPAPLAPVTPELSGTDENGKPVKLTGFAGKACMISFFTSGCNLCLHDLKLMREFNNDNRNKSFVMLGVSLDEQQGDYQEYAKLLALTVPAAQRFPLMWRKAPGHSDNFGNITSMPTHFVLDKAHKLVRVRQGSFKPDDWDDLWTIL